MARERKRESSLAARSAHARNLIRRSVGFVPAFPTPDGWQALAGGEPVALSGRSRSAARRQLSTLESEYALELKRIVGAPRAWLRACRAMLEHEGTGSAWHLYSKSVRAQASKLESKCPELGELLSALSWTSLTRPDAAIRDLEWINEHVEEFYSLLVNQISIRACLELLLLARHRDPGINALVQCLADERLVDIPQHGGEYYARRAGNLLKKGTDSIERPSSKLSAELWEFVTWLGSAKARVRRRALYLFALTRPDDAIEEWKKYWASINRVLSSAQELRRVEYAERDDKLTRLQARLRRLQNRTPRPIRGDSYTICLRREAETANQEWWKTLTRHLHELAAHPSLSASSVLVHWSYLAEQHKRPTQRKRLRVLAEEWTKYALTTLESAGPMSLWSHALRVADPRHVHSIDDELITSEADISDFFVALRQLALKSFPEARNLVRLLGACGQLEQAIESFRAMAQAEIASRQYPSWVFRCALLAADGNSSAVPQLAKELARWEQAIYVEPESAVLTVLRALAEDRQVFAELVVGGDAETCLDFIRMLATLQELGGKRRLSLRVPRAEPPPWAKLYPKAFTKTLAGLHAASPKAEKSAQKILGKTYPDKRAIQKQIEGLERAMDNAEAKKRENLGKRRDNLRKKLEAKKKVPTEKLERLHGDLKRAYGRALLEQWSIGCHAALKEQLERWLNVEEAPEWLLEKRVVGLISATLELDPPIIALARRLFALRAGPGPWDLRGDDANRRFLQRMRRRGIDMAPWLDGIGEKMWNGGKTPLTLRLADDPLEVFEMGEHFGTCLSPGDMNFFSVFGNAADINKRVLYAYRRGGKVAGRCLLALTDAGGLLAFHTYEHDDDDGFNGLAGRYVKQLAAAMGTVIVGSGEVSNLVTTDWYDDGPEDLVHQFPGLANESELRKKLSEKSTLPQQALELLAREFQPFGFSSLTVPMALSLPEVLERPDFLLAFVPLLRDTEVSDSVVSKLAQKLSERGHKDAARELFVERLGPYLLGRYAEHEWLPNEAVEFGIEHAPARILDVLRQTRARGVRSFTTDLPQRRLIAARALAALRRPRKALEVYESLRDPNVSVSLRRSADKAAKELRAQLQS